MFIKFIYNKVLTIALLILSLSLSACSSTATEKTNTQKVSQTQVKVNPLVQTRPHSPDTIRLLEQQHQSWKGTKYRLGGTTKKGVDCSGFTQTTYRNLFGKNLPRMTVEQAKVGKRVDKKSLKAGDLVFFNTGRGPNGKHVGIYVKDGQFLHASSKKGVIYSNLNSPYWSKTFWQARRL